MKTLEEINADCKKMEDDVYRSSIRSAIISVVLFIVSFALLIMFASCSTIKKNIDSNYKAKSEKRFQDQQHKEQKKAEKLKMVN